ncbi:hypothetical protein JCM17960_33210 [Magnetospira thiophila]
MLLALFANDSEVLEDVHSRHTETRLAELAQLFSTALAPPLVERDSGTLQDSLDAIHTIGNIEYLLLYDSTGQVMARSGWAEEAPPPDSIGRPGKGVEKIWHASTPITLGGQIYGTLYFGISTADFIKARQDMRRTAAGILGLAIVGSTLLFSLIGYWLTRRLRAVAHAAEALALHDQSVRVEVGRGGDEIDRLGHSFNAMAEAQEQYLKQLRASEKELKRSNQDLEQFVYLASHDLQTPLRTVTSYVQLLERRYADKLDKDGREFIAFAANASKRMSDLILNLLNFSRIGADKISFAPVSMQAVWEQGLALVASRITETGAIITQDKPLPHVLGDRSQLEQLIQNLLENALKYRRKEVVPEIHFAARREGLQWHFTLSDNGMGVAASYQERIFLIFQRLHTDDKYEGTGIGLALCRKIVERYGGRIWIESAGEGQGATLHFTLYPAEEDAAQKALSSDAP